MKIYQVTMSYTGGHEHGSYRSSLFARREDAEAFLMELGTADQRGWWSEDDYDKPVLVEHEILDGPCIVGPAQDYLHITYT